MTTTIPAHPTASNEPPDTVGPTGSGPAWRLVATREVLVKLSDRNFLIGTLVTLLLIGGLVGMQAWLGNRAHHSTVAVLDEPAATVVRAAGASAHARDDKVTISADVLVSAAAGEQAVREGQADALLTRGADGWRLTFHRESDAELTGEIAASARQVTMQQNAVAAGTAYETLTSGAALSTERLDGQDDEQQGFRTFLGYIFALLFYVAALMFGIQIAQSVIEEKQSRIVEILVTAIPIRSLLVGKVMGNTAIALAQMALYAAVGLVGLSFTQFAGLLPSVAGAFGWFLAFFLAGFLALATIWAAAGALATRSEDLQATTTPLTMVLILAFVAGMTVAGTAKVVASFVPILSAILMPGRIVAGDVAWWEPVLALALTLAFAAVSVTVGARLYRNSLLQTGTRLGLRAAWRHEG
ncbi:MAG: ABC transporter permease [Dermatophilaceae bacterium]